MKLDLSPEFKAAEHVIAAINVRGGFPDPIETAGCVSRAGYLAPSYKAELAEWLATVAAEIRPDQEAS